MDTSLYLIAQAGFILLTVIYLALFVYDISKGIAQTPGDNRRKKGFIFNLIAVLLVWTLFVTAWSVSGKMADFSIFPFNLLPVILIPAVMAVAFLSSRLLGQALQHIPAGNLIRLQSFRFFVEVLLWVLYVANLLPVQMTFEGRNFDILVGISAPVVALLAFNGKLSKKAILIWNVACLGLLLNIVITAILSTPSPWRVFMNEPANDVIAYFPMSWLPGLLVPLAYYLHLLSIKQLLQSKKVTTPVAGQSAVAAEK
jgi:hypothetical protein